VPSPPTGPCGDWTTPAEVRDCCEGLDPAYDLTEVIEVASELLFGLSGARFPGICSRLVRPCKGRNCGCGGCGQCSDGCRSWHLTENWLHAGAGYPSIPVPIAGGGFANCSTSGSCCGECCEPSVELPAPIAGDPGVGIEVVIDGVVLAADAYEVRAYRRLVRVDGGSWPCTNNFSGDSGVGGDDGTWQITYDYGRDVPAGGRLAARILACQLALARCGAEGCILPQRLREIDRQGVSMVFADPLEFLAEGLTGIYEADLWLSTVNPTKLKRRGRVHRADDTRRGQTRADPIIRP